MAEPADMIVPLLREMRAELSDFHADMISRLDAIDREVDVIEGGQASIADLLSERAAWNAAIARRFGIASSAWQFSFDADVRPE